MEGSEKSVWKKKIEYTNEKLKELRIILMAERK